MKIQDIKLMKISVKQNKEIIYDGDVDSAPDDIKTLECKSVIFDSGKMLIIV